MTKETKIGLLVGLTFIILFAIILSEKGTSTSIRAPIALSKADGTLANARPASPTAAPLSGADTGRFPVERGLTPPSPESQPVNSPGNAVVMLEEPVNGQPIPTDASQIGPIPEEVRNRLNMARIETEVPIESGPARPENGPTMSVHDAVASAIGQRPTAAAEEEVPLAFEEEPDESRLAGIAPASVQARRDPGSPGRTGAVPETAPPTKAIRVKAVHVVEPGESLGKIAARHYGRSNPRRVEAIFNANRDTLKTVHSVKANTKLNIPMLDANGDIEFEPADGFSVAQINGVPPRRDPRATGTDFGDRIPLPAGEGALTTRATEQVPPGRDGRRPASTGERLSAVNAIPETSVSPSRQPPPRSETKPPRDGSFIWYEVRPRDTLSRIARRELGSERLVGQLYDLNRDILTDKHKLKIGAKIRVPMRQALGGGTGIPNSMAATGGDVLLSP